MEKILKEILAEVKDLKHQVVDYGQKLETLGTGFNGMKEEHGQILRAILESKEVQRGEIDTLTHRTAKIEGTIKGAAKHILDVSVK